MAVKVTNSRLANERNVNLGEKALAELQSRVGGLLEPGKFATVRAEITIKDGVIDRVAVSDEVTFK